MKSPEKQLDTFIKKYDPHIAKTAKDMFAKLRTIVPNATILVYDNYNALAIGFGPSERSSDAILSIALNPKWVSLFFLQGAKLPDPGKHLCGSGKVARQSVLESADDLDHPEIATLIERALELAKVSIEPANESKIIIKSVSENQRPRRPPSK